jgi:hypothetical protein
MISDRSFGIGNQNSSIVSRKSTALRMLTGGMTALHATSPEGTIVESSALPGDLG